VNASGVVFTKKLPEEIDLLQVAGAPGADEQM